MAKVTRTSTMYFTSRKKRFAQDRIIPNAIVKRINERMRNGTQTIMVIDLKSQYAKYEHQEKRCEEKVEEIRQHGGHREDFPRKVDLGDEVCVPDQAVRGETDGRDEKRIRKGFDGNRGEFGKVQRLAGDDGEPLFHDETRRIRSASA